jgi:hypothetical protein
MPDYPTPRVKVSCNPDNIYAGHKKPVVVTAEILNPHPGAFYLVTFTTTSGVISDDEVWATKRGNKVFARTRWDLFGVEGREAAFEASAGLYESKADWDSGEAPIARGSDATIIRIRSEDIDIDLRIGVGDECGDFKKLVEGDVVCLIGKVKDPEPDSVYDATVRVKGGGPEFLVKKLDSRGTTFRATLPPGKLPRGDVTVVTEVERVGSRPVKEKVPAGGLPEPTPADERPNRKKD